MNATTVAVDLAKKRRWTALLECLRVRVKDLDFTRGELLVRDGKGQKDRVTRLPRNLNEPLRTHLAKVRQLHERDLADGFGRVYLPFALEREYPNADREWGGSTSFHQRYTPPTRVLVSVHSSRANKPRLL